MEQYIPKDALVAEIERIRRIEVTNNDVAYNGALDEIKYFLNTLEVKEVDLEKELSYEEYKSFFDKHPDFPNDWGFDEAFIFAKYFYSLGLKAQKGEKI